VAGAVPGFTTPFDMTRLALLLALLLPSAALAQQSLVDAARQHLQAEARHLEVPAGAAASARVTSAYTSPSTGLTHVYFRQTIDGIDVLYGDVSVTLRPDASVLHAAGRFVSHVDGARGSAPSLTPRNAAEVVATHLGLHPAGEFDEIERYHGPSQKTVLADAGIAGEPIEVALLFEETSSGLRLAWDVTWHEIGRQHVWSIRVDAISGEIIGQDDYVVHDHWGPGHDHGHETLSAARSDEAVAPEADWHPPTFRGHATTPARVDGASYRVFAYPAESPNHSPRSLVVNPANPIASPVGWHNTDGALFPTYTTSRGNNVFAYVDANNSNQPNGTDAVPDGGLSLAFDFPVDFTQQPSTYRLAAVTNLFYWNNLLHDILWFYGFDEAAGNFQETNFSGQGLGGDAVRAEAQDGGGTNNANFFTPVDGSPPRMQMYLWNTATPQIDGDFDNGIVAHEYAHGWSIRLTGGPNTVTCIRNREQMGEGWSDYLGLIVTMKPTDVATQRRGIGTFALNQPVDGNGIRPAPYTTDMSVNGYTYGNLGAMAVPHGVGFIWATMLWDLTWSLIDAYGFSPDLFEGTGGNAVALRLVSEALKMQPCSPGFVDGRDAILAADQALYNGVNAPYIWQAFARRGLGYSASQGSVTSTTDGIEAFDLPPGMDRAIQISSEPGDVPAGELMAVTVTFINGPALGPVEDVEVAITLSDDVVYAPGSAADGTWDSDTRTLTYRPVDIEAGGVLERTFFALANFSTGSSFIFSDDVEDGEDAWDVAAGTGTANWSVVSTNSYSGSSAWYARNVTSSSDQRLILVEPLVLDGPATLRFRHSYQTESTWDGGVVEVSVNGGSWMDLGSRMIRNGYSGSIRSSATGNPLAGRQAFTGSSNGWVLTEIDLSSYAGSQVAFRFRMGTDSSIGYPTYEGWYVDDIEVVNEVTLTAEACASTTEQGLGCASATSLVLAALDDVPLITHAFEDVSLALSPGESDELTLTFTNAGDRDLETFVGVDALGADAWLAVNSGLQVLATGEDGSILIQVDSGDLDPGVYEASVTLVTNDPANPVVTVPVYLFLAAVGVDDGDPGLIDGFALDAPYPNPFEHHARLALRVADAQHVTVTLYDVMGREVARLHDGELAPGEAHPIAVDGSRLASGIYLLSIRGERFATTARITRLR
jgi:hypothetical protein